jgi:hypothetical protein
VGFSKQQSQKSSWSRQGKSGVDNRRGLGVGSGTRDTGGSGAAGHNALASTDEPFLSILGLECLILVLRGVFPWLSATLGVQWTDFLSELQFGGLSKATGLS